MSFHIIPIAEASIQSLINSINDVLINPLIIFVFALALVLFLYGVLRYLLNPDSEEVRKTSRSHMLWGVIGMVIMVSVFGIMNLILNTIGEKNIDIDSDGNYNVGNISNL